MNDPTPAVERVAAITERLSVLLGAGVPPSAAWRYLADAEVGPRQIPEERSTRRPVRSPTRDVIAAAALAARDGIDVPTAMIDATTDGPDGHAWRAVAAAWSVAIGTGARLAPCLAQLARSQRALGQAQRDIDAALAGPRSTSRFVMVLPVVGLLFGAVLGFDTVGTLLGTAPGLVCLALGIVLTGVAWRWSSHMVLRAIPATSAPGLEIDLLAIALSSGASLERARAAVDDALVRCRLSPADGPIGRNHRRRSARPDRPNRSVLAVDAPSAAIDGILALSRAAGIPAAELLVSEAARIRRDARSEAQRDAVALGTRLMIPLGLCILPAFMLVGVVPLMLSVLSSTVSGFE